MDFDLVDHFKIATSARTAVFTGREVDGNAKHHFAIGDFLPYFGVPYDERNRDKGHYSVVRIGEGRDIYQNKLGIIYVKRSRDVEVLRDNYSMTYESKILFHDRVKIDRGIKVGFTVMDHHINGRCFSCGGAGYHKISHAEITGR